MSQKTTLIDLKTIDQLILSGNHKKNAISKLGFFSAPIKVQNDLGEDIILKIYKPLKNTNDLTFILENHEEYILKMRALGVNIPETHANYRKIGKKFYLMICQKAFEPAELVRTILEEAPLDRFLEIMILIFEDILNYWQNKTHDDIQIGFHPTLRNYALKNEQLHYFDTFPPMYMPQAQINKLILKMAPLQLPVQYFLPQKTINRVSDEYYQLDKMMLGVIGSCCRLRPEFHQDILNTSQDFIKNTPLISQNIKDHIIECTCKAPKLSGLWVFFRKLFGNVGKPNIKTKV